jgi:hypothetical protein
MDVDDLYGLPLDRFTPERNALARELRNGGKRGDAAEVAALRKPSVAAWAVNQLVRTQRKAVAELFDAGDALRAAQDNVVTGRGDGRTLRVAVERERAAVDALTGAARGLLTSDGHELSQTIIDRVADTLNAAALDDEARSHVKDGRLERELRHVGLGVAVGATLPAPARRAAPKKPAADRAAEQRAERERAEARAAARATEREARRRLERAERAANSTAERRDRAAKALDEAEAELSDAESEMEEARDELGTAEQALRELEH